MISWRVFAIHGAIALWKMPKLLQQAYHFCYYAKCCYAECLGAVSVTSIVH